MSFFKCMRSLAAPCPKPDRESFLAYFARLLSMAYLKAICYRAAALGLVRRRMNRWFFGLSLL
ncbi:hypothetical protein [Microcoleus sp. PH2017_22_RUC_O_B]|uniref:hypothetical protein n=1 Tax=Microcoleus sp. PH2017_22_RUC_O_B TaxID=2798833 RepID=UPI0025FC43DC|nr:hypothetical protein [Microcoleus sp. PH2017_22_RUC_O_B]